MGNGDGANVNFWLVGRLALVVVSSLELAVGVLPVLGAEHSLNAVDGDAYTASQFRISWRRQNNLART